MTTTGPTPLEPEGARIAFTPLAQRLRRAAGVLAVLALVGLVVHGLLRGLSFAVMGLWAGVFVVGLVLATAVLVALHALHGTATAQARGERLSGDDVGLLPPRRR
jgi:hypothetical protein